VLEMARTGRVAMSRGSNVPVVATVERQTDLNELEFDSGVSFSV